MLEQRIGFIGTGQMATALGQGFVRAGLVSGQQLIGSDPAAEARQRFAEVTGGAVTTDNLSVISRADVVFLAVKPQQMGHVVAQLRGHVDGTKLLVSIAAGVRLATLAEGLGEAVRLVRVMPNTPCLVGHGACAYALGERASPGDGRLVVELLSAVGVALQVDEKLMDAVTGLSGSGPAFIYMVIEALSDGGVRMGLPRGVATTLAAQTVKGAAEMVLATHEHPGVLKDRVTSPGGTTIAGVHALEMGGLRAALMSAVEAAARRSAELASA
ncbi:MAG TPA: pyrroline-5-carboxylate reductase [Planctomycetaceae bacterium]|nr:pyrroline-5-carboxylate reductase [Planctomycetaceae bacterium]HIQ21016.1 pyrroline-5-carboxylate reductase [Planctomycetota bacterium]